MTKIRSAFWFIALVAVWFGAWWVASRNSPAIASPVSVFSRKAAPITVDETITVQAGKSIRYSLTAQNGRTPGLMQGRWTASGISSKIRGATDDTLVGFTLFAPDNKVIQKPDHPTFGNFSLRFETPGTYTFIFDNDGIIRSSARTVKLEGTYQAD